MPHYALGTARLSSTEPPTPADLPPSLPTAFYPMQPPEPLYLPDSEAGWNAAYGGDQLPVPTAIYACTETGGSLVDHLNPAVGGRVLVPAGSPLYGRRAVGLRATDAQGEVVVHPVRGVELTADGQNFAAADDQWGNPDGDGLALLVVYRALRIPGAGNQAIVGKRSGTGQGYVLGIDSDGRPVVRAQDAFGQFVDFVPAHRADLGSWHCSLVVIEPDAGGISLRHYNDMAHMGPGWLSGSPPSMLDTDAPFRIGGDSVWNAARCQVCYLALWKFDPGDPAFQCIQDDTLWSAFWTAYTAPPNQIDPPGDRLELGHVSTTGWPAGANPYGTGAVVAKCGKDQYPYAVLGPAGLEEGGFGANREIQNLLLHTEQFLSPWSPAGGASVATNASDAPDGMQGAARVTYSAGGTLSYTGLSPADKTGSVWARVQDAGTDGAATLYLGGTSDRTSYSIADLSHGRWVRLSYTYPPGSSETIFRIEVTTSDTVKLDLWGAQLEDATYPGPYVPAWDESATASGSHLVNALATPPPDYAVGDVGKVRLKARFPYGIDDAQDRGLFLATRLSGGTVASVVLTRGAYGGNNGRIILDIEKDGGPWAKAVSAQGTGLAGGQTADDAAEVQIELGWHFNDPPLVWLKVDGVDGTVVEGPGAAFSGFEAQYVCIGISGPGAGYPDASIYDVKIWSH